MYLPVRDSELPPLPDQFAKETKLLVAEPSHSRPTDKKIHLDHRRSRSQTAILCGVQINIKKKSETCLAMPTFQKVSHNYEEDEEDVYFLIK